MRNQASNRDTKEKNQKAIAQIWALVQTHLALISTATEQMKQWGSVVLMGRRLQTTCHRLRCAGELTWDAAAPNTRSSSRGPRDRRCLQPLQWPTWNWRSWEELRYDLLIAINQDTKPGHLGKYLFEITQRNRSLTIPDLSSHGMRFDLSIRGTVWAHGKLRSRIGHGVARSQSHLQFLQKMGFSFAGYICIGFHGKSNIVFSELISS